MEVWLAQDQLLGRAVTLFFVPGDLHTDPVAMQSLRSEVKRARQLVHPGVLRIHGLIEDATWAAIATEGFEGESLQTSLRKTPDGFFEVSEIHLLLAEVCRILADAHRMQFLHRDLSPENILILSSGQVILANFGLSWCVKQALTAGSGTNSHTRLAYMSPQQLEGAVPGALDDVYGFGILLHQLLTGQPPFISKNPASEIRRASPKLLLERRADMNIAGEEIDAAWEEVVISCLEKNPALRPQSIIEVAARLGFDHQPATEGPKRSGIISDSALHADAGHPDGTSGAISNTSPSSSKPNGGRNPITRLPPQRWRAPERSGR
jgi:serine/threonine-protein kinase